MDPQEIADGVVVSLDYTLQLDDGTVVETSEGRDPLEYLHGSGQIIPGLESGLTGLGMGESRQVVVPAAQAYRSWAAAYCDAYQHDQKRAGGQEHSARISRAPLLASSGCFSTCAHPLGCPSTPECFSGPRDPSAARRARSTRWRRLAG